MLRGTKVILISGFENDEYDSEQEYPDSDLILGQFIKAIPNNPQIKVKFKILVTCHILIGD